LRVVAALLEPFEPFLQSANELGAAVREIPSFFKAVHLQPGSSLKSLGEKGWARRSVVVRSVGPSGAADFEAVPGREEYGAGEDGAKAYLKGGRGGESWIREEKTETLFRCVCRPEVVRLGRHAS
jgi:hypothetical protein